MEDKESGTPVTASKIQVKKLRCFKKSFLASSKIFFSFFFFSFSKVVGDEAVNVDDVNK